MSQVNTLGYNDMATITVVKSFMKQDLVEEKYHFEFFLILQL
jgi:hypothetical protein